MSWAQVGRLNTGNILGTHCTLPAREALLSCFKGSTTFCLLNWGEGSSREGPLSTEHPTYFSSLSKGGLEVWKAVALRGVVPGRLLISQMENKCCLSGVSGTSQVPEQSEEG